MKMYLPSPLTASEQNAVCDRHLYAAFHTPPHSKQKQIYELYPLDRDFSDQLHTNLASMTDWQHVTEMPMERSVFSRLLTQCGNRTKRHTQQCCIANKGVWHRGHPYIVHIYMFDRSKTEKVEITVPRRLETLYESELELASEALLCLEEIVPTGTQAKFPSDSHDMNFELVRNVVQKS